MTEKKVFQLLKTTFRGQNEKDTNSVMNTTRGIGVASNYQFCMSTRATMRVMSKTYGNGKFLPRGAFIVDRCY